MANYFTQITDYLLTQSWQIAVLVAAVAAVNLVLKNRSAHVRYLLWLIVLAKCLVPPLLAIPLPVLPPERSVEPAPVYPAQIPAILLDADYATAPELPPGVLEPVPEITEPTGTEASPSFTAGHRLTTREWLGLGWLVGVAAFTIAALAKALRTVFWLRRRRKPLTAKLQTWIENEFSGLGFGPLPKVWLIEDLSQPFVWGLLRGSIYLPTDFVKLNKPEHRRGLLGHELSHVLRCDAAVNLLQVIAQGIFWFHPFVWWANKRIRAEREKCCDEMAIARLGTKAKDYSTAIVNTLIAERKSTRPVPSLAVAGPVKNIEERIKTMTRPGKKFYKHPSLMAATVVLLLALLTVPTAFVLTARAQRPEPAAAEPMEAAPGTIPKANLQIPDELKSCAERLRTIYYALKRYEKDKGSMPDWLSDLVPEYLSAEMLIWPEDGPKASPLAAEPHLPCSFGYQYSSLGQVPGGGASYRQFKDEERLIWGEVVPLVRYYVDQKCLNLSFDGRIYFSGTPWEKEIPTLSGKVLTDLETVSIPVLPEQLMAPTESRPPLEAAPGTVPKANRQIPDELKPCAQRLRTIYYALKLYEKDKGSMPDWLSDLVPGYLSAEMLIWPEDGLKSSPLAAEPHMPCSFGYQYSSLARIPGGGASYRQYKDHERLIWGDVVPLVRYYRDKDKKCLNLSFDGRIYFSGSAWETEIPTLSGQVLTNLEITSIPVLPEQVMAPTEPRPPLEAAPGTVPEANRQIPDELKSCAERLRTIYYALKLYEKDKGNMPDWLSDLVPEYLSAEMLIWPEDGPKSSPLAAEPHMPCSFGYQYSSLAQIPSGGPTYRQFKDQERLIWGDIVPLVRYYVGDKCLNLSFDGRVYFSSTTWEKEIPTLTGKVLTNLETVSVPASPTQVLTPTERRPSVVTTRPGGARGKVLAFDDFDGKLGLKWEILHPDKSHYSLSERPGALTITTQNGHFKEANANYENVFVIDTPGSPDQDFQITTCLLAFEPQEPYHQAGLICWDDQDNYLEWIYQKMDTRGLNFNAGVEADGPTRYTYIPADTPPEKLWLRVTKRGSSYECSSSTDGQSFTVHTVESWGDGSPKRIGFFALNGSLTSPPEVAASFDFFEVSQLAAGPTEPAASTQKFTIPQANLEISADMKGCAQNLQAIYAALKEYEKDKGRMPDWLSQLVPRYLGPQTLFCTRDSSRSSSYWPDPNLPCSYCYELNPTQLRSRPPLDKTMRDYKNRQREFFGDVVPIVRCFHHGRTVLNLTWDGRLYTSAVMFEELFTPAYQQSILQAGTPGPVTKTEVLASDDFDGKLALQWQIVNPNPSNYSLSGKPGSLTITTKKGHFSKQNKEYENVFLIDSPAAEGQDFQITTCISSFVPQAWWNQAGILCWDDEDNYVKLVYEWAGRPAFTVGYEVASSDRYDYQPAPSRIEKLWLRITKRGDSYKCATSTDGESFVLRGSVPWKKDSPKCVGLFANNGSFWRGEVPDLDASFEFFEVAVAPPESAAVTSAAPGTHTYESDLKAFIEEMDRSYPFFELKGIRNDWEKTKKHLQEKVLSCESDGQFLEIVTEAILCLRDSHMWFRDAKAPIPKRPPRYYPGISFLPATNGRVVIMNAREGLDPDLKTGTVVTQIDGTDARRYLEDRAKAAWAEGGNSGPQRARLFAYRIALRGEKKGEKHTITILVDGKQRQIELASDVQATGWPHWYNRPDNLKQVGSCSYAKLPSEVGYVYLRRVDSSTGPGMKEAFSSYPDAKGWIIDLRGNGGGGYDQALYTALRALPGPLAVTIDAGCISAGETMARDLARYGNARLFGSKTAGASSAKRVWQFPSGIASVSVPTRSRGGIGGKPIEFLGIAPHVEVEAVPEELKRGSNSEILRAEEYLAEITVAKTQ